MGTAVGVERAAVTREMPDRKRSEMVRWIGVGAAVPEAGRRFSSDMVSSGQCEEFDGNEVEGEMNQC